MYRKHLIHKAILCPFHKQKYLKYAGQKPLVEVEVDGTLTRGNTVCRNHYSGGEEVTSGLSENYYQLLSSPLFLVLLVASSSQCFYSTGQCSAV